MEKAAELARRLRFSCRAMHAVSLGHGTASLWLGLEPGRSS
jgi:hypothetical protein